MLDSYIVWNGVNSNTLGLIVKKEPNFNKPRRKHKSFSLDARNGDIFSFDDAWENVIQEYVLFADLKTLGVSISDECHQIARWLHSANGYVELSDSYDTTHYRLACLVDEVSIENHLNEFITVTVRFNCRPECFLNSGKTAIVATEFPFSVTNPTGFPAYPRISVNKPSSGDVNLRIGTSSTGSQNGYVIAGDGKSYIYINCDERFVSDSSSYGTYQKFESSVVFPMLSRGTNYINFSTSSGAVTASKIWIYPNWWEL